MDSSALRNKISKKNLIIIAISIFLLLIILMILSLRLFNGSRIFPNVFIENVNVGRLTPREATLKVNEAFKKEMDAFLIELAYDDDRWQLTSEDLDLYYLFDDSIEEAYKVGRTGNYFQRIKSINNLRKNPKIIKLEPYYNMNKVESKIEELSNMINKPAINAKIERKNGGFVISKEVLGVELEKEILKDSIITAIRNFNNDLINIQVKNIQPEIIEENLRGIRDLIGQSFTAFNSQDKGRTENIRIAVNVINNTVLMPGEEFSFNDRTGPRSEEAGYKEASVIVNGEFVTGIGGGICQVSTTLYQAVVRSDLEITERRNHGLPVGYVPMGQDATLAYGYIDLKFKNNKDYPIYIESFIKGEQVYVKLYSNKTDNVYIDLTSEVVEVVEPKMQIKKDSNMYLGERKISKSGKKGYRVVTYKVYLKGGRELKREVISKDYYPSRDGIIIEGTKQE